MPLQGGAQGGWVDCLSLADYTIGIDDLTPSELLPGATFRHAGGRVTSLCVAETPNRGTDSLGVSVISGSSGGTLSAVQVLLPLLEGATLEDVQVCSSATQSCLCRFRVREA
jgi:hypothetical protein